MPDSSSSHTPSAPARPQARAGWRSSRLVAAIEAAYIAEVLRT